MAPAIILIGLARSGKTTLGKLLAAELGMPFCSLPEANRQYFA